MLDGKDSLPEDKLKEVLAPFEKTDFQEKTDRHPDTDTVEPFPKEVFKSTQIGKLAAEFKRVYGIPESMACLTALGVHSAACGTHFKIEGASNGHNSYPILYIMLVAESGTGKSSVFQRLAKPIIEASAEIQEKANLGRMESETRTELLKEERKCILRKISRGRKNPIDKDSPEYGELEGSLIEINRELNELENFQAPTYYAQNINIRSFSPVARSQRWIHGHS